MTSYDVIKAVKGSRTQKDAEQTSAMKQKGVREVVVGGGGGVGSRLFEIDGKANSSQISLKPEFDFVLLEAQ